jgi:hypothetical protein
VGGEAPRGSSLTCHAVEVVGGGDTKTHAAPAFVRTLDLPFFVPLC